MQRALGAETLAPGLRRLRAPNPSPMTYTGTNTYLLGGHLGGGEIAVIDPGPDLPAHAEAILAALAPGERIAALLVTHAHRDHSPLARRLAAETGAPVYAAGPADWGRRPVMAALAATGGVGGGEGVDTGFVPDRTLREGDVLAGDWGRIEALETPGHMAHHLCFAWQGALFSGDLVMGWSTSLISPPDGDLTAFMASVARLAARDETRYYPGHGEPIDAPQDRCRALIAHRQAREAQILDALAQIGPASAPTLARHVYGALDPSLLPAAARNVLAHLIDLMERNRVTCADPLTAESVFTPHPAR